VLVRSRVRQSDRDPEPSPYVIPLVLLFQLLIAVLLWRFGMCFGSWS
jgi:hypothetical protein